MTVGVNFSPLTVGSTSTMVYTITPTSFTFASGDIVLITFPTPMVGTLV